MEIVRQDFNLSKLNATTLKIAEGGQIQVILPAGKYSSDSIGQVNYNFAVADRTASQYYQRTEFCFPFGQTVVQQDGVQTAIWNNLAASQLSYYNSMCDSSSDIKGFGTRATTLPVCPKKFAVVGTGLNAEQTMTGFYKLQHLFPHLFGNDQNFYIANQMTITINILNLAKSLCYAPLAGTAGVGNQAQAIVATTSTAGATYGPTSIDFIILAKILPQDTPTNFQPRIIQQFNYQGGVAASIAVTPVFNVGMDRICIRQALCFLNTQTAAATTADCLNCDDVNLTTLQATKNSYQLFNAASIQEIKAQFALSSDADYLNRGMYGEYKQVYQNFSIQHNINSSASPADVAICLYITYVQILVSQMTK